MHNLRNLDELKPEYRAIQNPYAIVTYEIIIGGKKFRRAIHLDQSLLGKINQNNFRDVARNIVQSLEPKSSPSICSVYTGLSEEAAIKAEAKFNKIVTEQISHPEMIFGRLLLRYPPSHKSYTGKTVHKPWWGKIPLTKPYHKKDLHRGETPITDYLGIREYAKQKTPVQIA